MPPQRVSRRQVVGGIGAVTATGLAGCGDILGDGDTPVPPEDEDETPTEEDEEEDDQDEEEEVVDATYRAANAVPDAMSVDVYLAATADDDDDDGFGDDDEETPTPADDEEDDDGVGDDEDEEETPGDDEDDEESIVDTEEPVLEGVEFRSITDYEMVTADENEIAVTESGQDEPLFEDTVDLSEVENSTGLIHGELGEETVEVQTFEDDNEPAGQGEARVRVIHASPDAPDITVTAQSEGEAGVGDEDEDGVGDETPTPEDEEDDGVGDEDEEETPGDDEDADGEELASGLGHAESSAYVTLSAGSYTLEVSGEDGGWFGDDEEEDVGQFDAEFDDGGVHTVFAMGYVDPDEGHSDEEFDLTVTADHEDSEDGVGADDEDDTTGADDEDEDGADTDDETPGDEDEDGTGDDA